MRRALRALLLVASSPPASAQGWRDKLAALAGCDHLYVDIGVNKGSTLKRWYETGPQADGDGVRDPIKPGRKVVRDSRLWFGGKPPIGAGIKSIERQHYCSVALEANPVHDAPLLELATALRGDGKKIVMFNGTALTDGGGAVTFNADATGGSLVLPWPNAKPVTVPSIDAVELLSELNARVKRIALKIDVEGVWNNARCRVLPACVANNGWPFRFVSVGRR